MVGGKDGRRIDDRVKDKEERFLNPGLGWKVVKKSCWYSYNSVTNRAEPESLGPGLPARSIEGAMQIESTLEVGSERQRGINKISLTKALKVPRPLLQMAIQTVS